ncbi:alpha/beta hydrolase fold domain-containing protein [Chloroflexota bacterium]
MRRLIVVFSIAIILLQSVLSCTPTSQSPAYTPPSVSAPAPIPTPIPESTPTPTPAPPPAPEPTPEPAIVIPTTPVEVIKDIKYGKAGNIPLLLDVYIPETPIATPMPAIVYIHGGSWRIGNKAISNPLRSYRTYLARHGFLTVSINYRLSGVAPFPAAVEDCKCAVRWLRANAERYNVDPERIGVWGASAGGHLAMMVGCVDETADLEGNGGWSKHSSRVQAVCSYYGTADLPSEYPTVPNVRRSFDIEQFLGGTLDEFPQIYEAASPINYVTADDPPLLLVHGDLDPQVPFAQSEIMYRVCQQAGLKATLIEVTGGGHGGEGGVFQQVTDSPISPSFDEIHQIVMDFFIEHLLLNR